LESAVYMVSGFRTDGADGAAQQAVAPDTNRCVAASRELYFNASRFVRVNLRSVGPGGNVSDAPRIIAVDNDEYHAEFVGRTADGRQFFLTTPFVPALNGTSGAEYLALYTFDDDGSLLDAQIHDFGPRATLDHEEHVRLRDEWLRDLGDIDFQRIEVQPFEVQRFGESFGLVVRPPEEDGDVWAVEAQPGNFMAFFEPWDSGEYDT
jgi:hypothetical protein